jgi:excisionase family DNA binding protein
MISRADASEDEPTSEQGAQPMLTRDATAAYLSVSTRTIDRLVRAGDLTTYRIGGHRRFRIEDIDSFINSRME